MKKNFKKERIHETVNAGIWELAMQDEKKERKKERKKEQGEKKTRKK